MASNKIAQFAAAGLTTKASLQQQQQQQQQQQGEKDKKSSASSSAASTSTATQASSSSSSVAPSSSISARASMTTTVLNGKLATLTEKLQQEREARIKAQEELKKTCAELEALESVLHLRAPPLKKKTYN